MKCKANAIKAKISNPATIFFDTVPIIYTVFRMSKCRINKYKAGFGSCDFTQQNPKSTNGSLDSSLAAKLAAREAQDSQLFSSSSSSQIITKPLAKTKENDIDTILGLN
jgi:hypothetical protein